MLGDTMSQYNEYGVYNDTLNGISELPPLEEELLQHGVVSSFTKKLINTTRSAEEKLSLVEKHKLTKELNIGGYQKGTIVSMGDSDSGEFIDETGNKVGFRFTDLNPLDAIDKQKARERSPYKAALQPKLVADLTGKAENELIEEDYTNVANYQFNEMFNSLTNKDHTFSPYDKSRVYEKPSVESIPFAYKVVGEDDYGRKLIEAINPETGRQISFDMSNNPYLNSSFDLYKSIDSNANRERLGKYIASTEDAKTKLSEAFDTDGRLGENIDTMQSTAYQSAARLLQYGPDWLVDKKKWESIANAKTGQLLADAWAGVKTSTRRDFANNMMEANKAWDKGDYLGAITGYASQLDRVISESATQMGLMLGAGTIASTVGAPAIAAALTGASVAAVDSMLMTEEEHKANNDGKGMSGKEMFLNWAGNVALLIPEALFAGVSFTKLLPKPLRGLMNNAFKEAPIKTASKAVVAGTVGEGVQEGVQDSFNKYFSQDERDAKSYTDILFSDETAQSMVIGGMAGGAITTVGAGGRAISNTISNKKALEHRDKVLDKRNNVSTTTAPVDPVQDQELNKAIEESSTVPTTPTVDTSITTETTPVDTTEPLVPITEDEVGKGGMSHPSVVAVNATIKVLQQKMAENPNASEATVTKYYKHISDLRKKALTDILGDSSKTDQQKQEEALAFSKLQGQSSTEIFSDIVYHSDMNAEEQFLRDGKEASESALESERESLEAIGRLLGIPDEEIKKTIADVQNDIRHGARGYYRYRDNIQNSLNILNDETSSEQQKNTARKTIRTTSYDVARLFSIQLGKLKNLTNIAEQVADGSISADTTVKMNYHNGENSKSFNVRTRELADLSPDTNVGVHKLYNAVTEELRDLRKVIDTLPEEERARFDNSYSSKSIDQAINRYERTLSDIRSKIRAEVDSVAANPTIVDKVKGHTDLSVKTLSTRLANLAKGTIKGIKSQNLVIGQILSSDTDAIRKHIENDDSYDAKRKESILKKLDQLLAKDKVATEAVSKFKAEDKATLVAAKKLTSSVDKAIKTTDTTKLNTIQESLAEMKERLADIKEDIEGLSTLRKKVDAQSTEVVSKLATIKAEEAKKAEEPIEESVEDTPKNIVSTVENKTEISKMNSRSSETNQSSKHSLHKEKTTKKQVSENMVSEVSPVDESTVVSVDKAEQNKAKDLSNIFTEDDNNNPNLDKIKGISTKEYATNDLFDPEKNRSMDIKYKGEAFDVSKELKVSKHPSSLLAVFGSKDYDIASVKGLLSKFKLRLDGNLKTMTGKAISNITGYINHPTRGILATSPHLRILYDIKLQRGKASVEYNDLTLAAIDLAIKEYVSTNNLEDIFDPKTDYDVCKIFGINPDKATEVEKAQIKEVLSTYGISRTAIANALGKAITANLGIVANKEDSVDDLYMNKVSVGLGLVAIDYAIAAGIFKATRFDLDKHIRKTNTGVNEDQIAYEKSKFPIKSKTMSCIRLADSREAKATLTEWRNEYLGIGTDTGGLKEKYIIKSSFEKKPRTFMRKAETDGSRKIRNTQDVMNVPSFTNRVINNKLQNTKYIIDTDSVDLIMEHIDNVAARLGFVSEEDRATMSYDDSMSAEGVNAGLLSQFKALRQFNEGYKQGENKGKYLMFDWFVSKNGRLFIDSNTLNPQTSKHIQRFLVLPEKLCHTRFDPNDEYHISCEAFAIAQAFDKLGLDEKIVELGHAFNLLTLEQINDLRVSFVSLSKKDFYSKLNKLLEEANSKPEGYYGLDGEENFGQVLNVLKHLKVKKEFLADPKGKNTFQTALAVENDSTTSGYFLRLLQFPDKSIYENYGKKLGVLEYDRDMDKNITIHALKKTSGFLDIYKTMAKAMSEKLEGMLEEGLKTKSFKYLYRKKEGVSDRVAATGSVFSDIFSTMIPALPLPTKDAEGNTVVTSELRKFMKPPAMTFGYNAGRRSISASLAHGIMKDFIKVYIDLDNFREANNFKSINDALGSYLEGKNEATVTKTKAVVATMQKLTEYNKNLLKELRTKSVSKIWLKVPTEGYIDKHTFYSLDGFFEYVIAPTYGDATYDALDSEFSRYGNINKVMNKMTLGMFYLFQEVYNAKVAEAREKNDGKISYKDKDAILEELKDMLPVIRLLYSDRIDEGMMLMGTSRDYTDTQVNNLYTEADGTIISEAVYADNKRWDNAGLAGAVLPIHYIDGMAMAMVLNKYGDEVIPVHDAVVMSALKNEEVTKDYNGICYGVCHEYDMFDQFVGRFKAIAEKYDQHTGKNWRSNPQRLQNGVVDPKQTLGNLITEADKLLRANEQDRRNFYSKPMFLTNMDGLMGSGIRLHPKIQLKDILFKDVLATADTLESDPNGYYTDNEAQVLLEDANASVKGRLEMVDALQNLSRELGNKVESEEHVAYLKSWLEKIDTELVKDTVVKYTTGAKYNAGQFNMTDRSITIGFDNKSSQDLDPVTQLHPFSGQSPATIYTHEILHAAIKYAEANRDLYNINDVFNKISDIQLAASSVVTWEDFMPDTYDPALKDVYEANAKKVWDYIFDNPDTENRRGLHEFISYGLTHPKVVAKLQANVMPEVGVVAKTSFLDKLISHAKNILDVVFRRTSLTEALEAMKSIHGNSTNLRRRNTMYYELDKLVSKVAVANNSAFSKLMHHPMKLVERLFGMLYTLKTSGNKYLAPLLEKLITSFDRLGIGPKLYERRFTNTKAHALQSLLASAMFIAFSRNARKNVTRVLKENLRMSQQGIVLNTLREMSIPDQQSSRLEALAALTSMADQTAKSLESLSYAEITDKFGGKLKDEESASLTKACLFTDIQCLLNHNASNISEIKQYLTDKDFRQQRIDELTTKLRKQYGRMGIWYTKQAECLGHYMVTGIGNEALNLNAFNIAEGRLSGTPLKNVDLESDLVKEINILATLHAIDMTDTDSNTIAANLSDEGLANYLRMHRQFVKETHEGTQIKVKEIDPDTGKAVYRFKKVKTVHDIHTVKGYTKSLYDTSYDIKIDFANKQSSLSDEGYVLVRKLGSDNKITGMPKDTLALYRRSWAVPNRRDGATFVIMGAQAMGTSLKESAYDISNETNRFPEIVTQTYMDTATAIRRKVTHMMYNPNSTADEIASVSSGYTPIVSPYDNRPVDYRITMSNEAKVRDLGMNMDGTVILSKMFATQYTKANAAIRNNVIVEFLRMDMENNMDPVKHTDKHRQGFRYILIPTKKEDVTDKFLKEAWEVIPQELKNAAKTSNFYVREDWLLELFGVPNMTLSESRFLGNRATFKRGVAIAEYILKTIAYIAKRNILMLVPGVLYNNVMSNMAYSVLTGNSPIKVAQRTLDNTKAIRDYVETRKKLNRIELREKIGTATEAESKSKNMLQARLEGSSVHPLMEKGMYQAIVEDINADELESIGKIQKLWKGSKALDKVPSWVKWTSKQLFMTEGTPIYDFMFQATQYSDFVARVTEYQNLMDKCPHKEWVETKENGKTIRKRNPAYTLYEDNASAEVWNAFVNYNKPQSSIEQYADDLGLVMFIKYFKRIQGVIGKQLLTNPMGVLMFLLGQHYLIDTEDLLEQNIMDKSWSSMFHNPVDNFVDATVPMPIQYMLDMRTTGF